METYSHGRDKIGRSLAEAKGPGDAYRDEIGDGSLDDENGGNDGQLEQFVGGQLRGQFGKDCSVSKKPISSSRQRHTQTGREQRDVQISHKLLLVGVEHALARDNITRQTDADDLHDGLEDQHDQMAQGGMGIMVVGAARNGSKDVGKGACGQLGFDAGVGETEGRGGGEEAHDGGG